MKFYEIDAALSEILENPESFDEDGCLLEEAATTLNALSVARDEKIEGLAVYYKELTAEALAIRQEELTLADRRRKAEKKSESLKNFLSVLLGGKKFETSKVACNFRKSQRAEIEDPSKIPETYFVPQEPKLSLEKVKKALKTGVSVPGAKLLELNNLSIK